MYTEDGNTRSSLTLDEANRIYQDKADREFEEWLDQIEASTVERIVAHGEVLPPRFLARIVIGTRDLWFKQLTGATLPIHTLSNPLIAAKDTRRLWNQRNDLYASRLRFEERERRKAARLARIAHWFAGPDPMGALIPVSLVVLFYACLIPWSMCQEPDPLPTNKHYVQASDTDHPSRTSSPHIAYSDDTFTITLSGCEENAKEHWSCKYETPDGQEHWMYIPNFKPKHTTPTKP